MKTLDMHRANDKVTSTRCPWNNPLRAIR